MDYLIPQEYIDGLSCLLDDAPTSTYESVASIIQEDLGKSPEDLFDKFDPNPFASASLAQVHVAYDKKTGQKLAIKVQHKGLRETCRGDIVALHTVVQALEFFFEDFNFGWIADEIAPQLPKELDFHNEGKNAEKASSFMQKRQNKNNDVVIPKVHWEHTTKRVLCMEFEEGFRATDIQKIREANMNPRDVARLISHVFNSQVFLDAWVHCDPHPAVRKF
jgi:aarF domain-containing kinase